MSSVAVARLQEKMIRRSPVWVDIDLMIERLASSDMTVLITGDTGTGKRFIAESLHAASMRARSQFVYVNCTAIPEGLIEGELFGSEPGSFTNARRKLGLVEVAESGTLMLDEVGSLDLGAQKKLLRMFDESKCRRLGAIADYRVTARIVAATNENLETLVEKGGFHRDLFYRLDEARIHIPPLCNRREDIIPLAEYFLQISRLNSSGELVFEKDPDSIRSLENYTWPGNAREMRNLVNRVALLRKRDSKTVSMAAMVAMLPGGSTSLNMLERGERARIEEALISCHGNIAWTARSLGLHRTTFMSKAKKLGIPKYFGKA